MALLSKCILASKSPEDGVRISVMSRHTLKDGVSPDKRITADSFDFHFPELAPSPKLIGDYYKRGLTWKQFETRFKEEMTRPIAIEKLQKIINMALHKNVTLLCIEETDHFCHRRLLLEICDPL